MTVRELINILDKINPDFKVTVADWSMLWKAPSCLNTNNIGLTANTVVFAVDPKLCASSILSIYNNKTHSFDSNVN
ncbi:MAG: hypothetical protein WDA42_08580 [Candidatus Bathyarchaeia archaeon]